MSDHGVGNEPIAVVGMALRVPGASTPEAFWRNIIDGRDSLMRLSLDQLRRAGVSRHQLADPQFVWAKPLLKDIDTFDAPFFGMASFEAERTEPAQRLFLECAWEAMERAAIAPGRDESVIGVFAGVEGAYLQKNLNHLDEARSGRRARTPNPISAMPLRLGNGVDFVTSRVSHKLDLIGPSVTLLAACATALAATHVATQALRRRECDVAIVGGGSIEMPQIAGYVSNVPGMLSTTGSIRPFDANADGTIFGDGIGVVVLRPLADALAEGNPIHAVIRGSAMSNDGNPPGKESFIAPSPEGQTAAIEGAMRDADVGGDSIGYVEAHGTATLLGDPVEVASVARVYRRDTSKTGYCALGSVKANVGHLRGASGVVSLIKACLALEHRQLPPLANFSEANPKLDLASSPFFINAEALAWNDAPHPRRAAVSSFGFGGTNAHLILEEFARPAAEPSSRREHLYLLSARSEAALTRRTADLATHLDQHPDLEPADVAHTLQRGREAMPYRVSFHVNQESFRPADLLRPVAQRSDSASAEDRPLVFLFPGQGAQYPGMGHALYESQAVYRRTVDRCAAQLEPDLGFDIRSLIHLDARRSEQAATLQQTANAQPALFVVEYALAQLFLSWGARPAAMLGHSIGEIVAACLAGVFSLDDALHFVAARARLMQRCEPGAMLAVLLPENELAALLDDGLEIAAVNAPAVSVVSGPIEHVRRFREKLKKAGVGSRSLKTSHAFHSRMMDPALPELRETLQSMTLAAARIPVISNASGLPLSEEQATDPTYWSDHLRHTVRFSTGVERLLSDNPPIFLELGPGRTLSALVRGHDAQASTFAALEKPAASVLGQIWCAGVAIDWHAFYSDERRNKVALPSYPFQRHRYWIDPGESETRALDALSLYEPGWRRADLDPADGAQDDRPWLIFRDTHGLADTICERLRAEGCSVVTLQPGNAFERMETDSFSIRPGSREDLRAALAEALKRGDGRTPRVLHLWCVTGAAGDHNSVEAFHSSAQCGYYTLLALVQAAYDQGLTDEFQVQVVADGLQQMDGEQVDLHAEKGALLGPIRCAPSEFPGVAMQCIDVSGTIADGNRTAVGDALIAEARAQDPQLMVLLRPQGRFVEELHALGELPLGRSRLRERGTVLITGGVGALGLKVAEALFEECRARLVLTSRWQPPARDEWAARSAHPDKIGRALKQILALEARGAEVLIVTADIGNLQSLRQAIDFARSRFGPIHGVVHAAATQIDAPLLSETRDSGERLFPAKVHGAFHLEQLFEQTTLDIFVHFSSLASTFPGPGQTSYSASNAVLNILARRRSTLHGGLSCAIGWAGWQEIGMAAKKAAGEDLDAPLARELDHPLITTRHDQIDGRVIYRGRLQPDRSWVLEHWFKGQPLMPGVAILECLRATHSDYAGNCTAHEFSQVAFLRPLFVDDEGTWIEIEYSPGADGAQVEVRSRLDGSTSEWTVNATCVAGQTPSDAESTLEPPPISRLEPESIKNAKYISFGARWNCPKRVSADGDSIWVHLQLPQEFHADLDAFGLHPGLFDRALSSITAHFVSDTVPYAIDAIRIYAALGSEIFIHGRRHEVAGQNSYDLRVFDLKGRTLVEIDGHLPRLVEASPLDRSTADRASGTGASCKGLDPDQRVVISEPGDLDSVGPERFEILPPAENEIQIEVVAAGLNFRDVLTALGQMPDAGDGTPTIGSECSGIVRVVGPGETDLRVGDRVTALARNAFSGTVNIPFDHVALIPPNLSIQDAAGIPTVFLTAEYAINELARLTQGERILIHAAAGGVGLAAVQIAQRIGAEVFATAGREDKRRHLRELGVEHVMDSRSLEFVDEVREVTGGKGVDVVLNSLAGEFIPASLGLLRYRGRFVEIGKRDIYADTKLGLYPFRNNLAYFAIDLGQLIDERDPLLPRMFESLMQRFSRGELHPVPTALIPIAEITRGFRRMARAEHIGKIVFDVHEDPDPWHASFKRFQTRYGRGIPLALGLDAFRRLLASHCPPHYVLALGKPIHDTGQAQRTISAGDRARPDLDTAYRAATSALEERLVEIWENALGISPIGVDDHFFALGGDSITAIQTQFSTTKEFDVRLPMTALLEHPSIAQLAQVIDELQL